MAFTPRSDTQVKGYLALVLHAHLPFVRHPEHEVFLEENWLFEAITETYLPLLDILARLVADGVPFRLTLSISPPLTAMLNDNLLRSRYARRIDQLVELAAKEVERTRDDPPFDRLAQGYQERFVECRRLFNEVYDRDLVGALRRLQDAGVIDIITSAATHAYLPLLQSTEGALRSQVQIGVNEYQRCFGRWPDGFWLPECGYAPGIDQALADAGIRYFLLEAHGVTYAKPRPKFGPFAPVFCPSGVAAFARDLQSSRQVWSAVDGYPGDRTYREFYRDVGYDLDYDYIRPYVHPDGNRVDTGIKYYRITGADHHKEPYDPVLARQTAEQHATEFVASRAAQIEYLEPGMGRKPIVVAPYDAELFGHWWYEGPHWLESVLRNIAAEQTAFRTATPWDYLTEFPVNQEVTPCASSWGWKGYHEVWLEGSNDWIYRHLHIAAQRMGELAERFGMPTPVERRALNQAARELLLAQSSDWAFIMKSGTAVEYAVKRTAQSLQNFLRLYTDIIRGDIDAAWLAELERRDNIFPSIDYRVYM